MNVKNVTRSSSLVLLASVALPLCLPQVAAAQCCGRVSANQPRIVGGSTAARGAYPWMTALVERGQTPKAGQFCGGALIAPQWVLTAAHCIEDTTAGRLDVIVGAYNLNEANGGGQRVAISQIIKHPSYTGNGNLNNDVALLKLSTPVTNVTPIRLVDSAARTAAGQPCKGMGFGATSEGGASSTTLLHVDLGFFSLAQASSVYGSLTNVHLAAGIAAGGRDTCQGDSGGPLVVPDGSGGWMHAGVVSFGDGCARPDVPGIYANTLTLTPWIQQNMGTVTPPPPPPAVTDDFGNTRATAATGVLGTAVGGRLEVAGDVDVLKYTVAAAGTIAVTSTGSTAITAQWLNSAGTVVKAQTGAPNVAISATVSAAGTYYVLVKGATTATTGAYSFTPVFTPKPSTSQPEMGLLGKASAAIADGDAVPTASKGTLFAALMTGQTATQVFTVKNTGKAALSLSALQITGPGAAAFKAAVQPASSIAAGRSGTFTLAFSPATAGTHQATISIPNNDANESPYDFSVVGSATAPAGDDHGDDFPVATLVSVPSSRAGVLTANDLDYFTFTLTSPATVTLKTVGNIDTYGFLMDDEGYVLAEADDTSTDENFNIRRSLAAGTYYLEVSGYDETVTGAYTLQLSK